MIDNPWSYLPAVDRAFFSRVALFSLYTLAWGRVPTLSREYNRAFLRFVVLVSWYGRAYKFVPRSCLPSP